MSSGFDAGFNGEVFRRDFKAVIATKRELALIRPVRLAPKVGAGGYVAGQVLAKYDAEGNVLDGLFVDYDNGGASGRDTAVAVLLVDRDSEATDSAASASLAPALFKGIVFKDSLIGYESNAKTDLGAREISDASGVTLVSF